MRAGHPRSDFSRCLFAVETGFSKLRPALYEKPFFAFVMLYFALCYAVIFWVVAFKRPFYALVLIWSLAPIQTDLGLGGARYSLTELHLILLVPLLLLRMRNERGAASLGVLALPIGGYLLVCLLSTAAHWRGDVAVVSMVQMVLYLVLTVQIFASLVRPEELRRVPFGLVVTGAIWSIVGMASHFNFFGHLKNAFGATLAAAALVALDLWLSEEKPARRRVLLVLGGIIGMGLLLSLSRGGWLGALGGGLVIVMLRRASHRLMRASVVAAPLIFLCWNLVPAEQQAYAFSFDSSRYNIQMRLKSLQYAQAAFANDPILGDGVGLRKQYDATNVAWTVLGETGVMGALAFALIYVVFFRLVWRTRAQISTKDPLFSLLSIGAALMTCKLMHGMVDHYWTRGSITLAWGGAGMVLVAARLPAQRALEAGRMLALQKREARGNASAVSPTAQAIHAVPIHAYAPLAALPVLAGLDDEKPL